eukprot:gene2162-2361_t
MNWTNALISLVIFYFLAVYSYDSPVFLSYPNIRRRSLSFSSLISIFPKAGLVSTTSDDDTASRITDVVWLPCSYALRAIDDADSVIDDDHFLSALCDNGFCCHALVPSNGATVFEALSEFLTWFVVKNKRRANQLAIVADELSAVHALNFVSEVCISHSCTANAGSTTNDRSIGSLILIDPPPLHALTTVPGRHQLLARYAQPLQVALRSVEKIRAVQAKKKKGSKISVESRLSSLEDKVQDYRNTRSYLSRVGKKGLVAPAFAMRDMLLIIAFVTCGSTLGTFLLKYVQQQQQSKTESPSLQDPHFSPHSYLQEDDDEDNEDEDNVIQPRRITEQEVTGHFPLRITLTAQAMRNRLLVIGSNLQERVGSADVWGLDAIEEVAAMYQARPVRCLKELRDGFEENESEDDDDDDGKESFLLEESDWDERNKRRHHKLAITITDWLRTI